MSPEPTRLNLASIREKLKGASGRKFWRSLDELAETPEFQELLHREFPQNASEFRDDVGRREFLKLMAASLALAGLTACTKQPIHKIVPYVQQPELVVLGVPLFYATAMPHNGFGHGILVKSYEGHPVKIEGNPKHPISLGATNVFMQAALLDLYDPNRSGAILEGEDVSTWNRFAAVLEQTMQSQKAKRGAGLRILTETVTSPTLADQLQSLLQQYPEAKWVQYQPVGRDNVYKGAQLAFGQRLETQHAFDKAEVILSLDSDFLFAHPASLRYARHFTDLRRVSAGRTQMNRLYAVECCPTITGSMADNRLPVKPSEVEAIAREVARRVGVNGITSSGQRSPQQEQWISAVTADLQRNRGACIVIVGDWQPPVVHALAHAMNEVLGNFGKTVSFTDPVEANPSDQLESIRELTQDMKSGKVEALFILGGNPAFTAPAELQFSAALAKVPLSAHLGAYVDETSIRCKWHIPEAHFLESWSDVRAFDGTVSIIQPLIAPLYGGISVHEFVGSMVAMPPSSNYEIVRQYWKKQNLWADFKNSWERGLHDGVVDAPKLAPHQPKLNREAITAALRPIPEASKLEVAFRPDPCIWDGRFADNGWLQELAKPITKLTWDNAALISPALAETEHLTNGDMVELRLGHSTLRLPVWIVPGHADGSVTLHIGNGRQHAGVVGKKVGFDVYPLRTSDTFWFGSGLELVRSSGTHQFATTQLFHNVHSEERQILRTGTLEEARKQPDFVQKSVEEPARTDTLYHPHEHDYAGYRWAMMIDLTTCIGCNACVLGCQSENNIPVVGKTQVRKGRVMEWIRIDTYYEGGLENPAMNHMPVPCMHCENAPCELVCPVEATLHDHEGLNVQVYNRCVGTRFCSNNCPYKVRRFNFLQYQDYQTPSYQPMRNPQVTVRWRGVMEKCTYCIQRISVARINAEKENRILRDGEVQTACQQACPTQAIVFGSISDPESQVSRLRKNSLTFSMLGELNVRPRTTYFTKLSNPNPDLEEGGKPRMDTKGHE